MVAISMVTGIVVKWHENQIFVSLPKKWSLPKEWSCHAAWKISILFILNNCGISNSNHFINQIALFSYQCLCDQKLIISNDSATTGRHMVIKLN